MPSRTRRSPPPGSARVRLFDDYTAYRSTGGVIRSFADQATADVYVGQESKAARRIPKQIWPVVRRKLDVLHRARSAHDLRYPSAGHTGPRTIRSPKPSSGR